MGSSAWKFQEALVDVFGRDGPFPSVKVDNEDHGHSILMRLRRLARILWRASMVKAEENGLDHL